MSFLTPDEAFLRAAESDPGLELELFLEQVRSDIARGALRASGFRFQEKRMSTVIAPTPPFELFSVPMAQKFASRERVEIPPLSMADYSGPGRDGRIVRDAGADSDGWEDVRLWCADAPNHGKRGAYNSGERTKACSKNASRIIKSLRHKNCQTVSLSGVYRQSTKRFSKGGRRQAGRRS